MRKLKVSVEAGHGRYTPGKRTPDDEREWTFNDVVVRALIAELNTYENVEVLRVDDPTGERDVPLSERVKRSNDFGADVHVSVHHNANTGKWGDWTGSETYSNPGSVEGLKLAKLVHHRLVKAFGLRDRGLKQMAFYMVKYTNAPAILTEAGYMDSRIDIVAMRNSEKLRAQGKAIAEGVSVYLGAEKKAVAAPKPDVVVTPPKVEEETEMQEVAIVIGSLVDYDDAEIVAVRRKCGIYPRGAVKGEIAKELILIGAERTGLKASKITDLSGGDRFETSRKVKEYLDKM